MPFDYNNAVHNKQVSGGSAAEYLAAAGSDGIHTNTFYLSAENRLFIGKTVNSLLELALKTDLTVNYIAGVASNNHIIHGVNAGVLSSTLKLSAKAGNRTSVIAVAGTEGIFTEGYTVHPDSAGMIEIVGGNQIRLLPMAINDVMDAGTLSMTNYLNSINYSATNKAIQTGDFVICNAEQKIYIHKGTFTGTISDFQEMLVPLPTQATVRTWFSGGNGIAYVNGTGVNSVRLGANAGLLSFDASGALVSSLPTWGQVSGKPVLAAVATSGSYVDLLNKPTIPTAQVNSDWNATAGIAQILNKPTIVGTVNKISKFTNTGLGESVIKEVGNNVCVGDTTNVTDTKLNILGGYATEGVVNNYHDIAKYNFREGQIIGFALITLPVIGSTNMGIYKINGFNYSDNSYWSCTVSGYNYTNDSWYKACALITGNAPFSSVRVAVRNGKNVIILGTTTTVWQYPSIVLSEVHVGYTLTGNSYVGSIITIEISETGITSVVNATLDASVYGRLVFGTFILENTNGLGKINGQAISITANQISLNSNQIFALLPDETSYVHLVTIGGDGTSKLGKQSIASIVKATNGLNRASDGNIKTGGNFTEVTTSNLSGFSYGIVGGTTGKSVVFGDVATSPFMLVSGKVRNISDDFECTATGRGYIFKDDAGNVIRLRCNAQGNFYRELLS
jgi:hypothetical protein